MISARIPVTLNDVVVGYMSVTDEGTLQFDSIGIDPEEAHRILDMYLSRSIRSLKLGVVNAGSPKFNVNVKIDDPSARRGLQIGDNNTQINTFPHRGIDGD